MKKTGPRTEPWGTPVVLGVVGKADLSELGCVQLKK